MNGTDALLVGSCVLGYALVSRRLAGTPVTAAIVFVTLGLAIGSEGLDLVDLAPGSSTLRLLVEVTLALLLFSDAAGLDARRLAREAALPVRLLGLALPLTIVVGSLVAVAMFPDLLVFEAVALAVLLAPTDAALGQAVVSDPRLPSVVRQGLSVESGLNDGVCVPLLLAAVTFAELEEAPGLDGGVLVDLVHELLIAGVVGIVGGLVVGWLRNRAASRSWISHGWLPLVPLVVTATVYPVAVDLGGSGFIASFVAGLAYGRLVGPDARDDTQVTEDLGGLLNAVTLVLFGAVMVGQGMSDLDGRTVVYALLALTVLRMLPVAISLIGSGARRPTVLLAGWFGPRGLATIVFALTIIEDSGLTGTSRIVQVATVTVLLSVYAHGLSAPWLVSKYSAWFRANDQELTFETARPRPHR